MCSSSWPRIWGAHIADRDPGQRSKGIEGMETAQRQSKLQRSCDVLWCKKWLCEIVIRCHLRFASTHMQSIFWSIHSQRRVKQEAKEAKPKRHDSLHFFTFFHMQHVRTGSAHPQRSEAIKAPSWTFREDWRCIVKVLSGKMIELCLDMQFVMEV